jgi:hypothetical protein
MRANLRSLVLILAALGGTSLAQPAPPDPVRVALTKAEDDLRAAGRELENLRDRSLELGTTLKGALDRARARHTVVQHRDAIRRLDQLKREREALDAKDPTKKTPLPDPPPKKDPPPERKPAPACDHVSCVLNNYEPACCAKYKKRK